MMHPQCVCFLGGTRYSQPLDPTSEKKFRAMAALGQLFVIGFSTDGRPRLFSEHGKFYLLPKIPLPVLRYFVMSIFGPLIALWLILRYGVGVLVAQSPYEGFAAACAKIMASLFGRRVALVVESHNDFEESVFLQRRVWVPGVYRLLMGHAASCALRHADVLRAVSKSTRGQLEQWAPSKPIFVFVAWTDIEAFLRGANDYPTKAEIILYVGVVIPRKGIHHLIRAFARMARDFPEATLIIIGREENREYASECKSEVRRLGLGGQVRFIGEMPQEELARWMREARVLVLPSVSEALGRVVIEAMASGTPVLASDVGGIREMVDEGVTGFLVPPGDEAILTARLRWVLNHPGEAKEMGRHARAFAEKIFSTENYIQGYRQILERARISLERQQTNATSAIQPGHGQR